MANHKNEQVTCKVLIKTLKEKNEKKNKNKKKT